MHSFYIYLINPVSPYGIGRIGILLEPGESWDRFTDFSLEPTLLGSSPYQLRPESDPNSRGELTSIATKADRLGAYFTSPGRTHLASYEMVMVRGLLYLPWANPPR